MADFELAVAKTIKNEGGDKYTDRKNDRGGPTKYGISLRFLSTLKKLGTTRGGELLYPNANSETIKNLTKGEAEYIYLNYFWDANRYGEIEDQLIAEKVFDMAVLMGAPQSNKCFQRSLFDSPCTECVTIDGIIGPKTLKSINDAMELESTYDIYISHLRYEYFSCLLDICNKDKIHDGDLKGWLNRVEK